MNRWLLLAVSALACACGSKNGYVISGELGDYNGPICLCDKQEQVVDSVEVVAGQFTLTGVAEQAALYKISTPNSSFEARLILEAGHITVAADTKGALRVGGTPANEGYAAYKNRYAALLAEYRDPDTSAERRAAIDSEADQLTEKCFEQNSDNFCGVLMLRDLSYGMNSQELLAAVARFPEALQANPTLVAMKEHAERMAKVEIGQSYIEVVAPGLDGEEIALSAVVENPATRYTLLDFWASWCGPCMGEVPHLKAAYAEFHDKGFEIFGYSFDTKAEKWAEAVKSKEMNWVHVSTLDRFDNEAARNYAVLAIPTNYLIDSEGKIVAKNLRGEELAAKLAELLGE